MNYDLPSMRLYEQVALETVQLETRRLISEHELHFLKGVKVAAYLDHHARGMVIDLTARLLGDCERRQAESVVRVAADWWQAVKERWAPRWWLRRWPVKWREIAVKVTHEHWHVCPHVRVPDQARHVEFLLAKDRNTERPETAGGR